MNATGGVRAYNRVAGLFRVVASAVTVSVLGVAVIVDPAAAVRDAAGQPDRDLAGPVLSIPRPELEAALGCVGDLAGERRAPVLFLAGTALTGAAHFGWNFHRGVAAQGRSYCWLALPRDNVGDQQVDAEYVVHAVRTMHRAAGRRVSIVGGSKGGALPRWSLRFWPDIRTMVDDYIGLGPPNHGADAIEYLCPPDALRLDTPPTVGCAPSVWQLLPDSRYHAIVAEGPDSYPGISYTQIASAQDVVTPPKRAFLTGGGGRISNVLVQDVCPSAIVEHHKLITLDPVSWALAMDALTHEGPADPYRVDRGVCTEPFPDHVDPTEAAAGLALMEFAIGTQAAFAPDTRRTRAALLCERILRLTRGASIPCDARSVGGAREARHVTEPAVPRLRRAPLPTDAFVVVRGDDLNFSSTSRHQAEAFLRRFPDWGRWGLSAYYACSDAEIDDLAADRLERFPVLCCYRVSDLVGAGFEVWPTFRTPHVTIAFTGDLEAGLADLGRVPRDTQSNPYHQSKDEQR